MISGILAFGLLCVGNIDDQLKSELQSPGYTIPVIDLARDFKRQTVVDREPGQYLGHVTTTLLPDGKTILAVYPKGHGKGAIVYKRSSDGGKTWSTRLPTPESWQSSREVPTLFQTVTSTGSHRLLMFSGLYPIRLATSDNLGKSWSELSPIGDYGGIVAMSCMVRLRNGDYLCMFHDDGRYFHPKPASKPIVFTLYQTVSHDAGLTWDAPRALFASSDVHLCEPGIIRSPDGGKLAVLLRENSRTRNSHLIVSEDEGNHWSEPIELPAALTGDRHIAAHAPDGRLVISFRDTTLKSQTHGDWVCWVGTWDDIVNRREGQYRIRLGQNHVAADCGYPGLEVRANGEFIATTYGHWTEGEQPYIISVRFKLHDTDLMLKSKKSLLPPL